MWGSSNTTIATVDAMGNVTGITAGTATVSYTIGTGCFATTTIHVISLPAFISGPSQVCVGSTITLSDATIGGTWSSATTTAATIGITSGVATGISAGSTLISYSLGTGCSTSMLLTVNDVPAAITGNTNICVGTTTTLADATPSGNWTSGNTAVATTDAFGDVTGITPGTSTVSYTLGTGCAAQVTVTVRPYPTAIIGSPNVCIGSSYVFTDAVTGGTWTSSNTTIATIGYTSGVITGITLGTANIIYATGPGCSQSLTINVVPLPNKFTMTASGSHYCAGGTGITIGLNGSQVGTNYYLYVGGVVATGPLAGTGSALSFGNQTVAGHYTVQAVNAGTGCSVMMSGAVDVFIDPSVTPTATISTGMGDTVCSGTLVMFM
jgi:uncharacterized protein YjdB